MDCFCCALEIMPLCVIECYVGQRRCYSTYPCPTVLSLFNSNRFGFVIYDRDWYVYASSCLGCSQSIAGQNTVEVLRDFGFSSGYIKQLADQGVIGDVPRSAL